MYIDVLFCNDRCLCISVLFVGECLFVGSLVRGVLLLGALDMLYCHMQGLSRTCFGVYWYIGGARLE
jgi:hypothetical protein